MPAPFPFLPLSLGRRGASQIVTASATQSSRPWRLLPPRHPSPRSLATIPAVCLCLCLCLCLADPSTPAPSRSLSRRARRRPHMCLTVQASVPSSRTDPHPAGRPLCGPSARSFRALVRRVQCVQRVPRHAASATLSHRGRVQMTRAQSSAPPFSCPPTHSLARPRTARTPHRASSPKSALGPRI